MPNTHPPMTDRPSRALCRRADTLKRKAEELFALVLREHGPESALSDFADNVVHAAEELTGSLDRRLTKAPQ